MIIKNAEEMVYIGVRDGRLVIDEVGRVWRLGVRCWDCKRGEFVVLRNERRRAEYKEGGGGSYFKVKIKINGKAYRTGAHRLVWRHFNGPIERGLTVNHKDGDKRNNRPGNLELMSMKEQFKHCFEVLGHVRRGYHGRLMKGRGF